MKSQEQLAREAANAYKREWAKRNPEKVKAAQRRYWTKRAKEMEGEKDGEHKTCG